MQNPTQPHPPPPSKKKTKTKKQNTCNVSVGSNKVTRDFIVRQRKDWKHIKKKPLTITRLPGSDRIDPQSDQRLDYSYIN